MSASESSITDSKRAALLVWFDQVCRTLPWRRNQDPYRVWLSEIMLQQTRVSVVIPYYERFLEAFPTVEALAGATEDEVVARWSGLGYYSRARSLRKAARQVVRDGEFPDTVEGWLELPGVGPYTAAAVASIVYGRCVPAVDGNLERVISRTEGIDLDPKTAAGRRALEAAALAWLDPGRPGDGNQALMELGATICRVRDPECELCPVATWCSAKVSANPEAYPRRRRRRARTTERRAAFVVQDEERVLFYRRPADASVLPGTWELPWVDAQGDFEEALAERYGGRWRVSGELGRARHSITHRDLEIAIHRAQLEETDQIAEGREVLWTNPLDLEHLPHSSLVRKVLAEAGLDAQAGVGSMSPPASKNQPTSFS